MHCKLLSNWRRKEVGLIVIARWTPFSLAKILLFFANTFPKCVLFHVVVFLAKFSIAFAKLEPACQEEGTTPGKEVSESQKLWKTKGRGRCIDLLGLESRTIGQWSKCRRVRWVPIRGDKKSINAFLNKPADSSLIGPGVSLAQEPQVHHVAPV